MRKPDPAALTVSLLAGLLLTGCGGGGLTAELVTPVDIDLAWTAGPAAEGTDGAGQVVEYATEPAGPWTILDFLPAGRGSYRHPDLMPDTTFYYRVRPLLGAASAPVQVQLASPGRAGPEAATDLDWAEPRTIESAGAAGAGRPTPGAASGRPTDLVATPRDRDAVLFTWADNATDEDGQLIEVRAGDTAGWTVAMALDPDVNSAGLMVLPAERRAWFRVRAFTYGESSEVVHRRTGQQEAAP